MRVAYLITHPDVIIDPAVPIPTWPLSQRGRERMKGLLAQPWIGRIGSVHCSSERKATDGAQILAEHLSMGCEVIEELGEIDRSSTGYLPPEEHRATVDLFFAHPGRSVRGWETADAAQRRIVRAMDAIIEADEGSGDIAVVWHGTVGTLYLCHLKGRQISRAEGQPGVNGGHYYCFEAASRSLVHGWKPIDG